VKIRIQLRVWLFLALFAATAFAQKTTACSACAEWNRPQAPFRIYGNTYYVGPHGLASVLITSRQGHILIDGALPDSAQPIVANIRALGFRIEDVKLILNSHVHFDHAGGLAELQKLSGARVLASDWSAAVMKRGGVSRDDPQYGVLQPIAPIRNVHELHDGEQVTVGGVTLTAHMTPGHTPGGTSWTWRSCAGTVCRNLVYADSLMPVSAEGFRFSQSSQYPAALQDFEKSFSFFENTPCDILITAHPDVSQLWERLAARDNGKADAMVNSGACRQLAEQMRVRLQERLATERKTSE
jgi:metallo-beta-lactamase class B